MIDQHARELGGALLVGVRKDVPFFGSCGLLVGYLVIVQDRLKAAGWSSGKSWVVELFGDFLSMQAILLVMLGLILLACIHTLLDAASPGWPRLARVIIHTQERLVQLASPAMAFMVGMSAFFAGYSVATVQANPLKLPAMLLLLFVLVGVGCVTASYVAHKASPFDQWIAAAILLLMSLSIIGWILLRGV